MKLITLSLVLVAATASAQSITVDPSIAQRAAIVARQARENNLRAATLVVINARRAQELVDINKQRDAALGPLSAAAAGKSPLSAAAAGLSPLTLGDVVLLFADGGLKGEIDAMDRAVAQAKVEAVDAIRDRKPECNAKATAAGLDPAVVCK